MRSSFRWFGRVLRSSWAIYQPACSCVSWIKRRRGADRASRSRPARYSLVFERLEDRTVPSTGYLETALVSNVPGLAPNTDPKLINPWGFTETPAGQFRVAANGTGRGILFDAQGAKEGADIIIPPPAGSPAKTTSTPNGVVANPTSGFVITVKGKSAPATLLFSTEDGTIAGWNPAVSQTRAVIGADQSGTGAVYKLLTLGTNAQGTFIFATNFHNGTVDVFDSSFQLVHFGPNAFVDPTTGPDAIPSDFAPFGIKNFNGTLFVTYAKQDADKHDDVAGVGNGFIDEFDTSGNFLGRFATGGLLNSPIGAALAPANFGQFSNDVLIGNFGDSHVNAFDPATGAFLGQLQDTSGHPLVLTAGITGADGNTKGLWGIGFGNGQGGAGTQTLFFADGPNDESDGVFGEVNVAPAGSDPPAGPRHGEKNALVVVPSPAVSGGALFGAAALAANDIGAGGGFKFVDPTTGAVDRHRLAEHFSGRSIIKSPNPAPNQNALFGVTALSDVNTDQLLILQADHQ